MVEVMDNEIKSDGRTVWVNSGEDGTNLARFSKMGIDIHKTSEQQIATGKQCIDCKPGPTSYSDWKGFKQTMLDIYKIKISNKHMPDFLEKEKKFDTNDFKYYFGRNHHTVSELEEMVEERNVMINNFLEEFEK